MSAAIRAEHLSKRFRIPLDRSATLKHRITHPRSTARYRDFFALRDVSFEVPEGQFLGIIGHNGCGKSTLLKVLSRIYEPDGGSVAVNGKVSPFLELGVGFNPELTARENIYLNGAILGLTRQELSRRVEEIIAFAELEEFTEQKLKNYSSGMQVRLAFSVAIQAEASILLMDEVLAVGDGRFQEKCFDVFARYKREGRTVVLVTHDLNAVTQHCDRTLLIDHGRIIADGTPAEVTHRYRHLMGAQTEARDAAEAHTGERWGSREVEITDVRLLDTQGEQHQLFVTGTPLTVEVDYVVHSDVVDFIVAVDVQRSDGLPLAAPADGMSRITMVPQMAGTRGTIRYHVEALPLLAASYVVHVGLLDGRARTYDHIDHAAAFRVIDDRGRAGIVDLGGRWSVGVQSAAGRGEGRRAS